MPDDGLTTTAPSETASDSASSTPSEAGAEQVAETPKADPYAALADMDVDEIIRRLPTIQGRIGSGAQKLAAQQFQAWQEQQRKEEAAKMEKARQEELLQLSQNDPDELAKRVQRDVRSQRVKDREKELWQQFQRETGGQLEQQFNAFYERPIVKEMWSKTDDATRARLDWRNYPTIAEWTEAAADVIADYRADQIAETKAKKLIEAATKSSRIEDMAGEASEGVDLGVGGMVQGGRRFRRSELDPHSPDFIGRANWSKHREAIEYQMDNGLLLEG